MDIFKSMMKNNEHEDVIVIHKYAQNSKKQGINILANQHAKH